MIFFYGIDLKYNVITREEPRDKSEQEDLNMYYDRVFHTIEEAMEVLEKEHDEPPRMWINGIWSFAKYQNVRKESGGFLYGEQWSKNSLKTEARLQDDENIKNYIAQGKLRAE